MDVDATLPAPRGLDLSARRLAGLFLGAALALVPAEVGMRWYAPEAIGRAVDERVFPEDHPFNPQNGHVYLDDAITVA